MLEPLLNKIWELSPHYYDVETYKELVSLTNQITLTYQAQGRIVSDPFGSTRNRIIHVDDEQLNHELKGSICLVTGGQGCMGSKLVQTLLNYEVRKVIIIDNNIISSIDNKRVETIFCDIRNIEFVIEIFTLHQPKYVFHTAAQRDPGIAELNVIETITTNIIGTLNIVKACERVKSVKQMIYASTGKASRYYTEETYAASKKIGEFIVDTYARQSRIKYSIIRCTHILDNSLMDIELKRASDFDICLKVHSPGKYVTAQNVQESVSLMLNALLQSEEGQSILLIVKHLEWPVESLEVALYYRLQSRRNIPIVFVGNPKGYSEKFYRGQLDFTKPEDTNLLINVYEQKFKKINNQGDIIRCIPCFTDQQLLQDVLDRLQSVTDEEMARKVLSQGLKVLVQASLKYVDKNITTNILIWGAENDSHTLSSASEQHPNIIQDLLEESLQSSIYERVDSTRLYQNDVL